MNSEQPPPAKKPRRGAKGRVEGDGAVAQGKAATALGQGARQAGRDIHEVTIVLPAAAPDATADGLRQAYLGWLVTQANRLPLFVSDDKMVQLPAVYTALLTTASDDSRFPPAAAGAARQPGEGEPRQGERLSALEALDRERSLVLMGGPGSGKTTFLNFVALCLAGELLGLPAANLKLLRQPIPREPDASPAAAKPQRQRWTHGALLPVCVVLRDFAASLPADAAVDAGTLWRFIVGQWPEQLRPYDDPLHRELLGRGGLVLLDGLDEVPDAESRRAQVKQAVQAFAGMYGKCRFLVTSRTYAYQRQDWKLEGFAARELLPFTRGQIERFIDSWYAHMAKDLARLSASQAADGAARLKRATERRELRELAARPLLLTLMARLQTRGGGALPESREKLYAESVDMLLDEWERHKPRFDRRGQRMDEPCLGAWLGASRESLRHAIDRLAYEVHLAQPSLTGTADIHEDALHRALLDASRDRRNVQPLLLEDYLRDRAGLLIAHGEGWYQFPHRSFQEYLAACHLARFQFPDRLSDLAKADPDRWREVLLLAAAGARNTPSAIWELVEILCCERVAPDHEAPEPDSKKQWGALLAGQALHETGLAAADPYLQAHREMKRQRVRDWQRWLLRSRLLPARERALAGDLLAALGDPRRELLDVDHLRFAFVPRGAFWMGDEGDREAPLHRNETLDYDYWIAESPVTVAQFAQFVDSGGGEARYPEALRDPPNRPLASVSWHDALAFCAWLGERWRDRLPAGWSVALPSEAEWEKAARGGVELPVAAQYATVGPGLTLADPARRKNPQPQRAWPWGSEWELDRANAEEIVGASSTPGCFEAGRSPYGCLDMAGNVWEWTRSLWGTEGWQPAFVYPYDARDRQREDLNAPDDVWRVVRGGSWYVHRDTPAAPPASGFTLASGMTIWVFGWCCVLPLFLDSVLRSLRPLSLRILRLRRGCGGNFPRRAAPLIFTTPSRTVCPTSAFASRQHDHYPKNFPRLIAGTRRRPPGIRNLHRAREQVVGQAGGGTRTRPLGRLPRRGFAHAPAGRIQRGRP
ncbi:NACHT domain-containing protein [Candidatus Accumulibacter phosphatis]|uniref:Serine/threonine kinase n=1 Tax=Candidatus Accumulibacter phosphatis TaxID=327160 RepID=A0A5S4EJL2_9PROT|nr:SUMF1/EgtB/PvdO family nonheme iron enzyme [Candidatus Accumulibacter phosphatis]TMQ75532.1 serine/threonine kinase [Candidatus Accumulibacter phosphatis]